MENIAISGEVYVSKMLAQSLKGRIEFEYLGNDFNLKGLEQNLEIYRAVRLLDSKSE